MTGLADNGGTVDSRAAVRRMPAMTKVIEIEVASML